MPEPRRIVAYLCREPPFYVFGGITTWKVTLECYDKGGKRCALAAYCMQDPGRSVTLARGLTRTFANQLSLGIWAREEDPAGDMAFRLLRAAIKQGQMVADEARRDPAIPRRLR